MIATFALRAVLLAGNPATDAYLEEWLATFPSRATEMGRHDRDRQIEDLTPERRATWIATNVRAAESAAAVLADPSATLDDRLDAELIFRQARRTVFEFETLRRPERDPLFWTEIVGNATVFLLVRADRPEVERLENAAARAMLLPRLAKQARQALGRSKPAEIVAESCGLAARQTRASAAFYRSGFPLAGARHPEELRLFMDQAGVTAAEALEQFAVFLEGLERRATGSPRLGERYGELLGIVTGDTRPPDVVLQAAEAALAAKRAETAAYARSVWSDYLPGEPVPTDDTAVTRRIFERVAAHCAHSVEDFINDYRALLRLSEEFVRRNGIVTLPDPLTLHIDRSPAFFLGQSVGGVYPAGPFAPEADTLLYLPTPPAAATRDEREAFFREFNHHFNVMITPHEEIPGHYLQQKYAARHPRRVRAVFPDGVYVEGWGTFCERLMLDQGWGEPLDRLAHLKKQLENIARTIVDIRVHTAGMTRDEVLRFVRDEALQDAQFASNMWTRAITSSPQLTFYWLGYEQVMGLYDAVREMRGEAFVLREFTDGMMELGPVPVRHYRARMQGGR